ncbi:MAG: hypothetical protein AAGG46_12720, partial [Planctomycetota bacterium]
LLHEATHSFMMTELGGCGPAWFMEGMAELLGTHTWDAGANQALGGPAGELTLGVTPASRDDVPYWGRITRVRKATTPRSIAAVMKVDNRTPLPVEGYAWVWALAKFLDAHPRYRDRFRELHEHVLDGDFNGRFREAFDDDAATLAAEWRLFVSTLEYGHDLEREAIDFRPSRPLDAQKVTVTVRADRGWQPTGVTVKQGARLRFAPAGRFTVSREPDGTPWPCEANGVTLRYHAGRPLGLLLAAIGPRGLTSPVAIGGGDELVTETAGPLLLRLNDSPAELQENDGEVRVTISLAPEN